jgi:hypothetical protein
MMPPLIKEMFEGVQQDVHHLRIKIQFHRELFQRAKLQNELFKSVAHLLFNHLEDSLFVDILARIARLNDPGTLIRYKKKIKIVLTRRNIDSLRKQVDEDTKSSNTLLDWSDSCPHITNCTPFFKDTRDRFLSHTDWDRRNEPIAVVYYPQLQTMLELYAKFLNTIEAHYNGLTTDYEQIDPKIEEEVESLIRCLVAGAKANGLKPPEWASSWDRLF